MYKTLHFTCGTLPEDTLDTKDEAVHQKGVVREGLREESCLGDEEDDGEEESEKVEDDDSDDLVEDSDHGTGEKPPGEKL